MRPLLTSIGFVLVTVCALAQSQPNTRPRPTDESPVASDMRRDAALEAITSELRQMREEAAVVEQKRASSTPKPGPPIWSNWVLIVVTGFAVGAAYLSLRSLGKQVEAAKVSADVAKETMLLTHRPVLIVRNIVVDGFDKGELGDKLTNCRVLLANTGTTNATLIKAHAQWLYERHLPMENPVSTVHHPDQQPIVLAAGGLKTVDLGDFPLDFESHKAFFGEGAPGQTDQKVFVIGYAKYRDDLGTLRRTYFGRQFDRTKRRFVPVDHPAYEFVE